MIKRTCFMEKILVKKESRIKIVFNLMKVIFINFHHFKIAFTFNYLKHHFILIMIAQNCFEKFLFHLDSNFIFKSELIIRALDYFINLFLDPIIIIIIVHNFHLES